jgi:hypothetical protein
MFFTKNFNNIKELLENDNSMLIYTKRNILIANCSYLKHTTKMKIIDKKKYSNLLEDYNTQVNTHYASQEKNKKEEENMIKNDEKQIVIDSYSKKYVDIIKKKIFSLDDLVIIQKYLILIIKLNQPLRTMKF